MLLQLLHAWLLLLTQLPGAQQGLPPWLHAWRIAWSGKGVI
jgi:hypothetical protein